MTLRGSVASFPLETIVQLLAATAKTGQLEVRTGAESGSLGFAEGRLISAVSGDDAGDQALGAVFALSDGDFEFVPWGEPPGANLAGDLNQILDRAVVQRDKIVADRTLIADDRVRFALSDRAAEQGDVRLSADQWRALLAVNGERDLPAIARQLKLGRLATLAMLADLVRAGIVEVKEAPPEAPPPAGGSGSPGGAGGKGSASSSVAPPARAWGEPRAETTQMQPSAQDAPAVPVWDPPEEERETTESLGPEPVSDEPAAPTESPWGRIITPPSQPERPSRDSPAAPRSWGAPTEPAPPPPKPAPPPSSWDAPVEQTRNWQAPAAPTQTERSWGLPAQDWEKPAASTTRDLAPEPLQPDASADDSLAGQTTADEDQESETPIEPSRDAALDERLSALSGSVGTPAATEGVWPTEELPAPAHSAPAPVAEPEPKKKGGLFSGLFKKEEAPARVERPAGPEAGAGSRVTMLAALANALLDEFTNGQYGKGRVDDRISNLLMRVDEQADPIDRPLPVVDDRIDVSTLERASMSERQVAPYLALLISQIYEDAEHAFGKDKAKRGFKSVQAAVVGDPGALGTDLRLPRV